MKDSASSLWNTKKTFEDMKIAETVREEKKSLGSYLTDKLKPIHNQNIDTNNHNMANEYETHEIFIKILSKNLAPKN